MNTIKRVVTVLLFAVMMMAMSVMVFADTEVTFHFKNVRNWENVGGWIYEGLSFNKNVSPMEQSVLNASGGVLWPGAKCEDEGNGWFKITAKFTSMDAGAVLIFNNWTADDVISDSTTREELNQLAKAGVRLDAEAKEQSPNIMIGVPREGYVAFDATEYWISWDGVSTGILASEGSGLSKEAPGIGNGESNSDKGDGWWINPKAINDDTKGPSSGSWGWAYRELGNGEVEITDYWINGVDKKDIAEVIIPKEFDGRKVTKIGDSAFSGYSNLKNIKIPESVTSIGNSAFSGCNSLTNIMIPNNVTKIGDRAFKSCSNLSRVVIGSVDIGDSAFSECENLISVTMLKGVVNIGNGVFDGCSNLSEVKISNSVNDIGIGAFRGCSSLTDIMIPEAITSIKKDTFGGCRNLRSIIIPKSVMNIGDSAFEGCSSLTSISIPEGVISIGMTAFKKCESLQSVTISQNVKNIEYGAFLQCDNLLEINVSNKNQVYTSERGVLFDKNKLTLICFPEGKRGKYEIPFGVERIGEEAFIGCNNLTSIKIPKSVTSIGDRAFEGCSSLITISIPESVMIMEKDILNDSFYIFYGCSKLEEINVSDKNKNYTSEEGVLFDKNKSTLICFPEGKRGKYEIPFGVKSIGRGSFIKCSGLTSVTIPEGLTDIDYAFSDCNSLRKIIIPESVTNIRSFSFDECNNMVIYSTEAAYAHTFALKHNIQWAALPRLISSTKGKLATAVYTYNGTAKTPSVTITDNGKTLKKNTDYTVSYKNNNSIGTATVTVTGKGNYTGTKTLTFKINPAKTTSFKQSATYTTTSIKMSWAKVAGAAGYEVYRSDAKNGTYKLLKTVTTNSCINSGLKIGSKYYYKVRAYKTVNGKKVYGAYSDVKSMITKPSAPSNVSATAGSRQAMISWGKSLGANGYEVYMSTTKNGTYQKIKTANSSATSYTKTGLKKGQKYYFKVRAYKITGTGSKVYSGWSSVKSITIK